MARMIPPVVYSDCPSGGEREIFGRLRSDPQTKDWIVLHSLDVARHSTQISGEIDFVVVIPSKGVLCVEVKGTSAVRRDGGGWYYGHDSKPDVRGPFKQAAQAMHSVRERLVERRPGLARVVFWSAVIFPYVKFSVASDEWHPWQVIDSRMFRSRPIGSLLENVLDRAREFLHERSTAWFHPESREPFLEQCEDLALALRPDFEFFESPVERSLKLSEEVKRYTQEQFVALDAMEANPRVLFEGPAGTGKTLLAIEAAVRACAEDRRVLVVCFNRLIGHWTGEQCAGLRPNAAAGTLHSRMLEVSQLSPGEVEDEPSFWQERLPEAAIDRLLENRDSSQVFDEIIIDEAQDILRDSYLDFIDLSLDGGLASGRWRMFGDFQKQAIYGAANVSLGQFLDARVASVPVYSLRVNCRNTPRIAALASLLGGLEPDYSKVLRPDNRNEPELLYYRNRDHQANLLVQRLEKLYDEGFSGPDIVILSAVSRTACAEALTEPPWKDRIQPLEAGTGGHVGYTSIQAFKGMEAPAVVVTDIDRIGDPQAAALFYIAVTRALERLIILVHEPAKQQVIDALLKMPGWQLAGE